MKKGGFRNSGFLLRPAFVLLTTLLTAYFLLSPVFAHVPVFDGEGKSPEEAIYVEDPLKSRVLYGQLSGGGDVRYYSFEMEKGERILLGLIVPVEPRTRGFPDLVLMGPGIVSGEESGEKSEEAAEAPETVKIPEGNGALAVPGSQPKSATYEGFTPSAFYSLARLDLEAPENGTYYAAVNSPPGGGNYGVILGYRESFSLKEWLLIPLDQIRIYRWEGQGLLFIFSPLLLTLAVGFLIILRTKAEVVDYDPGRWSGAVAGLLFLGTGISFLSQMLVSLSKSAYTPEIIITLFLALAHLGLGATAIVLSLRGKGYGKGRAREKLYFLILGLGGFLLWAGWIVGSFLALEAGLIAWGRKE
ncbi:TPA: hypothetical protein HA351_15120 [Methanosarcinaceae archaeon]|nr:hypothetical protein [Methanosarcinaceae archaeon]